MKNKALNAFYTNLLKDVGVLDVNKDGLLSYVRGDADDYVSVTLNGKRLALPTRENLKVTDNSLTIFHPASEQLMSGPSPVLETLREYMMMRLATSAQGLAAATLAVASDVKLQKKVKGAGNELLKPLATADEKMQDTLDKVFEEVGMGPTNRIYNIFLVASGSKNNPRALRTAKVSYPIMDDAFNDDPTEFFGVKMPRKTRDKPAIVGLLSTILGIVDEDPNQVDEYSSELRQAPYFHSLLIAFHEIAKKQNRYIKSLKVAVPHLSELEYELEWEEEFNDFENFVKKVGHSAPLLPGNDGKPLSGDEDDSEDEDESVKSTSRTSWKDIRDTLPEEREDYTERRSSRVKPKATTGWKALLQASDEDDDRRARGISFGDRSSRRKRNAFSDLGRDDRDDRDYRRGRDRSYRDRDDRKVRNWRDRF